MTYPPFITRIDQIRNASGGRPYLVDDAELASLLPIGGDIPLDERTRIELTLRLVEMARRVYGDLTKGRTTPSFLALVYQADGIYRMAEKEGAL